MTRIAYSFRLCFLLLAALFITGPKPAEARGMLPSDPVVVADTQNTNGSASSQMAEPITGDERITSSGTLVVGGDGKSFTVQEGGSASLISGRSVRMLPGTKVLPGGQLTVKVTPARKARGIRSKNQSTAAINQIAVTTLASIEIAKAYRYFPMPEPETVSLAMNGTRGILPVRVRVSGGPEPLLKEKKTSFQYFPGSEPSMMQGSIQTLRLRWGEQPGNIRILRT